MVNIKKMKETEKIEYLKFFAYQRDKHVDQVMSLNGRLLFLIIALIGSFFLAEGNDKFDLSKCEYLGGLIFIGLGVISIYASSFYWSNYHCKRIKWYGKIVADIEKKEASELTNELIDVEGNCGKEKIFEFYPTGHDKILNINHPFFWMGIGAIAITIGLGWLIRV